MAKTEVEESVTVYKATHIDSGRGYIGLTSQWPPEIRWRQHIWDALNPRRPKGAFQRALKKYGPNTFKFEVLQSVSDVNVGRLLERKMIAEHNTLRPSGFNLTTGGEMTAGVRLSKETKEKISAANKRRCNGGPAFPPIPTEVRSARLKAYYAANPKKPESDKTRNLKSEAAQAYWERRRLAKMAGEIITVGHKTHKNSEKMKQKVSEHAHRQWLTRSRTISAEVKEKISAGLVARWTDPIFREKVSKSHTGLKHTPEAIAKMRASAKKRPRQTLEHLKKLSEARKRWWENRKLLNHHAGEA